MQSSEQKLAQTERLLGCYHQAVGHELPNQLVAIQGLARLIQQQSAQSAPEVSDLLQRLADLTKRTDHLVRALAELGRTLRRSEPSQTLALGDVWKEVTAETKWRLASLDPQFEAPSDLPAVRVPRESLRRVLLELILCRARLYFQQPPLRLCLSISLHPTQWVEVSIHDNAPIPSPEQWEALFDPYSPTLEETLPSFGPFLARELIRSWSGTLSFPMEGCRPGQITFTLPPADASL